MPPLPSRWFAGPVAVLLALIVAQAPVVLLSAAAVWLFVALVWCARGGHFIERQPLAGRWLLMSWLVSSACFDIVVALRGATTRDLLAVPLACFGLAYTSRPSAALSA